jgi:hypothetical protein
LLATLLHSVVLQPERRNQSSSNHDLAEEYCVFMFLISATELIAFSVTGFRQIAAPRQERQPFLRVVLTLLDPLDIWILIANACGGCRSPRRNRACLSI